MDFEFTEEQRQLEQAVGDFLAREFPFERLKALKRSGAARDEALWRGLVELGVPALLVPAQAGGLGYGPLETLALMRAVGPHLLLEPVFASAILATSVLRELAGEPPVDRLLAALASGDEIATLAHFEPASRFDLEAVSACAEPHEGGWRLEGRKSLVLQGALADVLLVSARVPATTPAGPIALFLVPRSTPGVVLRDYPLVDGQHAADVTLEGVRLEAAARIGAPERALPAIEAGVDAGLAALGAEAVAIMQSLLDATLEYLRTRQQFGQPIGRFQALRHRVADMLMHLEQARSMSYLAAMRCQLPDRTERRRALSAAKALIGEASRFVGQQTIQLHGGMGMTDELAVSHGFKRLTAIDLWLGDSDTHLERYTALMRETAARDV